jgi:hypothetical protein
MSGNDAPQVTGAVEGRFEEVLTNDALAFVADLQ